MSQDPAAASAQSSSPTPAAGTTNLPGSSDDTGDQPINLFEAAAQAGRSGSGGRSGTSGGGTAGSGGAGGAGAGGVGNLDFLRNNPQFQQLRQVVQQQPHMLEAILQQVGAGNPQLAQLISQHPEQFLQLLSEDVDDDAPLPPGAQAITVTEEEREAIERVSSVNLGKQGAVCANLVKFRLVVVSTWVRTQFGHPGLLCLRQE